MGFKAKSRNPGDVLPPTVPPNVVAALTSQGEITITWGASTDISGVLEYIVGKVDSTTEYSVSSALPRQRVWTGLAPGTHQFHVRSVDIYGNRSSRASSAVITVPDSTTLGWAIPDAPYQPPQTIYAGTGGQLYDVSQITNDPQDVGVYSIVQQLKNGVVENWGAAINPDTGVIAFPSNLVAPNIYTTVVEFTSGASAEEDWLYRAGLKINSTSGQLEVDLDNDSAAGVVFAHDFRHLNESARFSGSYAMMTPEGVEYKSGRNMDLTPVNPQTFETQYGYKTLLEFNSGAFPGSDSGYIRSVMPSPIAFNNWPADTWFEFRNATGEVRVHLPDGTKLPSASTYYFSKQNNHLRMYMNGGFTRPMTPIIAGDNGLPYADNAARGTIPRIAYPVGPYTQYTWQSSKKGVWTHSTFPVDGDNILGHEWWIQMRVRISPGMHTPRPDVSGGVSPHAATWSRWANPSQMLEFPPSGKLVMLNMTGSLAEEIVTNTGKSITSDIAYGYETSNFRAYTRQGPSLSYPMDSSYNNRHMQTNETRDGIHDTCRVGLDINQPNKCWEYPEGEWFTIMYHVRPGRPCTSSDVRTAEYPETLIDIKVARWGEKEWTTVYYDDTCPMVFGSPYGPNWTQYDANTNTYYPTTNGPPGHNVIGLLSYKNDSPSYRECWQEYTQVIFSTQEIPCPQVY